MVDFLELQEHGRPLTFKLELQARNQNHFNFRFKPEILIKRCGSD